MKETLKIALPVTLSQIGFTAVGFIDNVMVGSLGATALAAVSLCNSVIFVALAIGIGFSVMITPLASQAFARSDSKDTASLLYHGLLTCTLMGLLLYLAITACEAFIFNTGQTKEVTELARPYLQAVALSVIPTLIFQGFKQFLDGLSKTRLPMYCIVASCLINVFANLVLIYGYLGFPALGVLGAGIGTLVSRVVMLLLIVGIAFYNNDIRAYIKQISLRELLPARFKEIFRLGSFSSLQVLCKLSLLSATILIAGTKGVNFQAANQIVLSISSICFTIPMGIGTAAAIRTGGKLGAGDYQSIKSTGLHILKLMAATGLILATGILLGHQLLPGIYVNDATVILIASQALLMLGLYQLFDGLEVVMQGILKGLNDTKIPALISCFAYWCVAFPICYFTRDTSSLSGIWLGMALGIATSLGLLYARFSLLIRHKTTTLTPAYSLQ